MLGGSLPQKTRSESTRRGRRVATFEKQLNIIRGDNTGSKQASLQTSPFLQGRDIQAVLFRISKLFGRFENWGGLGRAYITCLMLNFRCALTHMDKIHPILPVVFNGFLCRYFWKCYICRYRCSHLAVGGCPTPEVWNSTGVNDDIPSLVKTRLFHSFTHDGWFNAVIYWIRR